jgi:DNA-binding MarR family transcriptional regulator
LRNAPNAFAVPSLTIGFRRLTLVKMLDETPPIAKTLFAAVAHLSTAWRQHYREEMARRGFPWHLTAVGDLLDHLPATGMSQSALSAATGLTKQAVQQSLDQLETHGVLGREPDPQDKRARRIVLTELGHRNLEQRKAVLDAIEDDARRALGKKSFKALKKTLRSLG